MDAQIGWLFVDINSYFATVEQDARPEWRNRPLAVVPVEGDSTCCIAVSYEAKAYGVRTGTRVREARALCPHLVLAPARPRLYVEYHHRIARAIERCIPIQKVLSCDEFAIRLLGRERERDRALAIAHSIKQELRREGQVLRCSIGLGPNRLLAKIACELQKPDGLIVFERRDLPACLYAVELRDIPGVGRRMHRRLRAAGIESTQQLCALSRAQMSHLWGGVWGDRLWFWLRGEDFLEPAARPLQTLGRQHILSPACRTPERARAIALKLLHSSSRKMRGNGLWAGGLFVCVGFYDHPACEVGACFDPCQDPYTLQSHFALLWARVPQATPADLTLVLTGLQPEPQPTLFDAPQPTQAREESHRLVTALDALNGRYGLNTVYLGSTHGVLREAPTRIPFGPPPPLAEFNDPADRPKQIADLKPAKRGRRQYSQRSSVAPTV